MLGTAAASTVSGTAAPLSTSPSNDIIDNTDDEGSKSSTGARSTDDEDNASSTGAHNICSSTDMTKCSKWKVLGSSFMFPVPPEYPKQYDCTANAPTAPNGREIGKLATVNATDDATKRQRIENTTDQEIPAVGLTTIWLKQAIVFAHHNAKTKNPDKRGNQKYWGKGNLVAYLRTCGITKRLAIAIYESAKAGHEFPPTPALWNDPRTLQGCHYAAMHMLFLGHQKSNFNMTSTWNEANSLHATFGKQVNKYLTAIRKLRAVKYFNAHPLSKSTWGTGAWVSENYLFWARCSTFFYCVPAIQQSRNMTKDAFQSDIRMLLRFSLASQAAMCRLMSLQAKIEDLDDVIKIYMSTMVEFDTWIINNSRKSKKTGAQPPVGKGRKGKEKQPNWVKANSLGILDAAAAHEYFGPAQLYWEGGYAGERKIQDVRPLLSIKRSNADWETIALKRLYQYETIDWLMSKWA
jgi:hypothetical protein